MESPYYTRLNGSIIENVQEELWRLERDIAALREDLWETIEDVAVGRKLDCPTCGETKPCCCDKGCHEKESQN